MPYTSNVRVRDVQGRTIAPNGTVTELRDQDVFDRTIVRVSGLKVKAKSFVLPNVVPGAIIEYRWREIRDDSLAMNLELELQREIPVHAVRYHIKPLGLLATVGYRMRLQSFTTASRTYRRAAAFDSRALQLSSQLSALRSLLSLVTDFPYSGSLRSARS